MAIELREKSDGPYCMSVKVHVEVATRQSVNAFRFQLSVAYHRTKLKPAP